MKIKIILIYVSALTAGLIFGQFSSSLVGVLPEAVSESSGLILYNDLLITHNDSGNTPTLYFLNKNSFKVEKKVEVANAKNIDWEDITQDKDYVYVGDFGNYWGDREDLVIYRIAKKDLKLLDKVTAEKIYFNYSDKTSNTRKSRSDYDAESLFYKGGELYILTKQWRSKGTVAYKIPAKPGKHIASKVGEYNTNGMVTGATYNNSNNKIVLVGYNMFMLPFVIEIENSTASNLFAGTVKKTPLEIGFAQIEGITKFNDDTYYLSSESFTKLGANASIYKLK
ncbi:MAG: T9SS type A sorting domain-containing protein [Cellulophaga sp.]